jgi:hypothetical protein
MANLRFNQGLLKVVENSFSALAMNIEDNCLFYPYNPHMGFPIAPQVHSSF